MGAVVQLVLAAVLQGQVAEAFGVDPATIWRWDQALTSGGGGRAGPGPARAQRRVQADARVGSPDRRAWTPAGKTLRQIAAATGVSTFTLPGRAEPGPAGRPGPRPGDGDADQRQRA